MTASAIKKDIRQLLSKTTDKRLLEEIKAIFLYARQHETDDILYFEGISLGENAIIQKGLDDIKEGRVHSHEDVREHINQILKKG